MNSLTQKEIERFWGHVDKEKSETFYNGTRCWEWTACKTRKYGKVGIGGKSHLAHRISYESSLGEIPVGFLVLHRCDNPPCVNPDHLFLGTQKDNLDDMRKKGRNSTIIFRGEKAHNHKLTDKQVEEIRKRYSTGKENQACLAKVFGVDPSQIANIIYYRQRT